MRQHRFQGLEESATRACIVAQLGLQGMASNAMEIENEVAALEVLLHSGLLKHFVVGMSHI